MSHFTDNAKLQEFKNLEKNKKERLNRIWNDRPNKKKERMEVVDGKGKEYRKKR